YDTPTLRPRGQSKLGHMNCTRMGLSFSGTRPWSARAFSFPQDGNRSHEDFEIERQGPVADVLQIEAVRLLECQQPAPADLRETRYAGLDVDDPQLVAAAVPDDRSDAP